MRASALEFRFRYALHALIYVLGLVAPWNFLFHLDPAGPNAHVWGLLAANLSQAGLGSISSAFNLLLAVGIACAFAAAVLRTWGAAYLGSAVVQDGAMQVKSSPTPFAGPARAQIVTAGPFRHLRNPLYVGTLLHTFALALLMPRSGAIFAIVATAILQVRLTLAEEAYLGSKLGESYREYCALVPRFFPQVRARVASSGEVPRWPQALLGEAYMWIVAVSMAVAGWRYNASLLLQCVFVAFGVSLILKAAGPQLRR